MKTIDGDIWDFHARGEWVAVTTNGTTRKDGHAVMGRGTARQCMFRYPQAPFFLGESIRKYGNTVAPFMEKQRIASFPVKHNWWEEADLDLIELSAQRLMTCLTVEGIERIYMPAPGIGNGGLIWRDVFPRIKSMDDRVTVVRYRPV